MLPNCSEYWDGTEISTFNPERQAVVMEMSKQWQQEGMTVHAFAYDPVSVKVRGVVFAMLTEGASPSSRRCDGVASLAPRSLPLNGVQESEIFDMIDEQLAAACSSPLTSPSFSNAGGGVGGPGALLRSPSSNTSPILPPAALSPSTAAVTAAASSTAPQLPATAASLLPDAQPVTMTALSSHAPLAVTKAQLEPVAGDVALSPSVLVSPVLQSVASFTTASKPSPTPSAVPTVSLATGGGSNNEQQAPLTVYTRVSSAPKPLIGLSLDANAIFLLTQLTTNFAQGKKQVFLTRTLVRMMWPRRLSGGAKLLQIPQHRDRRCCDLSCCCILGSPRR